MKRLVWVLCLIWAAGARGQAVSETEARLYADSWLQSNPLALRYRQVQGVVLEVVKTEPLAADQSLPSFYLVHLIPQGYLVMNSDRRLRPVVYFDFWGSPDLSNPRENTFYQLLLAHGRRNAQILASDAGSCSAWDVQPSLRIFGADEVIGPLLATSWGQGNYYNEYCPPAAPAPEGCDGRTPTGCVATAFAQIMKYYEWPYRGVGSFTYEDTSGSITGTHTAVFSNPYGWSRMQNEYYAFGQEPNEAAQAVAELMYELGVAARMNYEAAGSKTSAEELASRMRQHFLYETPVFAETPDKVSSAATLRSDLAQRRPCLAVIPDHSFVIDGHLRQGADDFFHVNYGASGQNDGWCVLTDVQGQAVIEIGTGIQPLLVAIPRSAERTAQGLELRWVLPKTRVAEVSRVDVLQRTIRSGTFTDHAEAFDDFEVTSTSNYEDWILAPGGATGNCFHKPAGGYANHQYHLTSTRVFRPGPETALVFQARYDLGEDGLRVLVSTDEGDSFTPVWSISGGTRTSWTKVRVPLGAYAGQDLRVRFEYTGGPYYPGGGVWIDDIELASTQWYDWNAIRQINRNQFEVNSASSNVTFTDAADAFTTFKVTSTSHDQDWSLSAQGYSGGCFYKPTGGHSNVKYHLTSTRSFRPGPDTQLTFKTKYALGEDSLSVLVSTNNGGSFSSVWSVTDTIRRNWTDVRIPLQAFAGRDILLRFEYGPGAFYDGEGVSLDEKQLVDITGAEYLAGPVYHTSLTGLGPGTQVLAYQLWDGAQAHPRSEAFTVAGGL